MTTPLVLSKSAVDAFLRCGYAYYLGYVIRLPSPPNLDMAIGTAVHKAAEVHWKASGDPEDALRAALVREVALIPATTPDEAAQANRDALTTWRTYLMNIAPTFIPTLVESPFLITIDGQLFSGVIDAADGDVHDTKTTSTPSKVDPAHHRLDMTAYAHGFRALTGRWPGRLLLDVVAKNGRWAVKEVKPDGQGLADVVGYVATRINAGTFEPIGAKTGECPRCPFLDRCPYGAPYRLDASGIMASAFTTGEGGS